MNVVNVQEFEESFVIHFGSEFRTINAYTFASTLVALADAAKSANLIINPGYEIKVVVEALGPGSFKAKIKTVYQELHNLFSNQAVRTAVLGIIASYIYQQTLAPDVEVNVIEDESQVVIEQGDKKIVIPRQVHDALKQVEKSEKFKEDICRTIESIEKDEQIESFGISKEFDDLKPSIEIPRSSFPRVTAATQEQAHSRLLTEVAELQIKRAILAKSRRRWEFVWRGVKISAPVLDHKFYEDFFSHKITIAPGDSLRVRLRIYQNKDNDTGIHTNDRYEVIEVLDHIPRPKPAYLNK